MPTKLPQGSEPGLEGLCEQAFRDGDRTAHRIRIGPGSDGIERLEAHFTGQAFSPHRHDTYSIGITLAGIQTFLYRGERRYCVPGQAHILHPDETHDGGSGTQEGFCYKIIHIDPALVQQALGGKPLPFVADPIVQRRDLLPKLIICLRDIGDPIDDVERLEMVVAIAAMLETLASTGSEKRVPLHLAQLSRVREFIAANPATHYSVKEFERVSDLDRWTLARQFRAAFGTSPSRFRTTRQLDRARLMINRGMPLSEVALEVGFADQSHMSRMFKRTYGLTPAKWAAALVRSANDIFPTERGHQSIDR